MSVNKKSKFKKKNQVKKINPILKKPRFTDNMNERKLRSSISPEDRELEAKRRKLEQEAKLNRPFINYIGKINYATTFIDCAIACDNLLNLANQCLKETFVVGFDMEWPFNFQTGPGKTALIQISPDYEICHLLHVSQLKSLPKGLVVFLQHPKVRLTGVNIKNDVRKLSRDFSGFDVDQLLTNCIDSGVLANTILPITQRWSMEKLVDYVLEKKINKDKKVRMSKWHIVPLKEHQQVYAALDGYASLLLFHELKKIENRERILKTPKITDAIRKLGQSQQLSSEIRNNFWSI